VFERTSSTPAPGLSPGNAASRSPSPTPGGLSLLSLLFGGVESPSPLLTGGCLISSCSPSSSITLPSQQQMKTRSRSTQEVLAPLYCSREGRPCAGSDVETATCVLLSLILLPARRAASFLRNSSLLALAVTVLAPPTGARPTGAHPPVGGTTNSRSSSQECVQAPGAKHRAHVPRSLAMRFGPTREPHVAHWSAYLATGARACCGEEGESCLHCGALSIAAPRCATSFPSWRAEPVAQRYMPSGCVLAALRPLEA